MKLAIAVIVAVLLAGASYAFAAETCFYKSERVSGMNTICNYSCVSGDASITVKSTQLCPLNVKR